MRIWLISKDIVWLANPHTALWAQIVAMIWQGIPFFTIMLLSSLQTVPVGLFDAARIDGANKVQEFRYIILPHLTPTTITTILLRIIWVANNVEVIYMMTQGGPGSNSLTLTVYTYIQTRASLDFGYSSALAVYNSLFLLVIMFFYFRVTSRWGGVVYR